MARRWGSEPPVLPAPEGPRSAPPRPRIRLLRPPGALPPSPPGPHWPPRRGPTRGTGARPSARVGAEAVAHTRLPRLPAQDWPIVVLAPPVGSPPPRAPAPPPIPRIRPPRLPPQPGNPAAVPGPAALPGSPSRRRAWKSSRGLQPAPRRHPQGRPTHQGGGAAHPRGRGGGGWRREEGFGAPLESQRSPGPPGPPPWRRLELPPRGRCPPDSGTRGESDPRPPSTSPPHHPGAPRPPPPPRNPCLPCNRGGSAPRHSRCASPAPRCGRGREGGRGVDPEGTRGSGHGPGEPASPEVGGPSCVSLEGLGWPGAGAHEAPLLSGDGACVIELIPCTLEGRRFGGRAFPPPPASPRQSRPRRPIPAAYGGNRKPADQGACAGAAAALPCERDPRIAEFLPVPSPPRHPHDGTPSAALTRIDLLIVHARGRPLFTGPVHRTRSGTSRPGTTDAPRGTRLLRPG